MSVGDEQFPILYRCRETVGTRRGELERGVGTVAVVEQEGEDAHVHAEVYLETGMDASVGGHEHVYAEGAAIGGLGEMLLVVGDESVE